MNEESFFANPRTWVGVAFVIFFVAFGRKIWAALTAILDKRAVAIQAELDEASRLRRDAEAMLADATARRQQAIADAEALITGARAEAERVAAAAAAEAEVSMARREAMARDRISAAEKSAVDDLRRLAAEIATDAARDVIAHGLTADEDSRLVDGAIAQLPTALSPKRAA